MKKNKISFEKLFLIFIAGSVLGAYYEQILLFVEQIFKNGIYVWETRSTLVYGPFAIVYGIGASSIVYLTSKLKLKWYEIIIYCGILCGFIEFIVHLLQQIFTSTCFWDYSNKLLNINGRTTIPLILVWGIFSYLFIKYLYPTISLLIDKIPLYTKKIIVYILIIFMIINIFISCLVMKKYSGYESNNIITKIVDYYYNENEIKKIFPHIKKQD